MIKLSKNNFRVAALIGIVAMVSKILDVAWDLSDKYLAVGIFIACLVATAFAASILGVKLEG